jgi:C1A family cysteine protease
MGLRALTVRSNSGSHRRSDGSRGIDPPSRLTQAPPVFDWRDYNGANWITPIKDQGNCGSCWAFATIGTVEAMYNIRAGYPELDPDLSEQYLVSDCHIAPFYDQNCCGGSGRIALRYVRDYGIPDEDCMPYVDGYFNGCTCSDNTCDWNCEHSTGDDCSDTICDDRCSDWNGRLRNIDSTDALDTPDEIKENIAYLGPATASMCMGTANCGAYWDGDVYRCEVDDDTDHLVVLVGYDDAGQYWIAKNSWGSNWEDGGYFKIGYGECSIETWAYNADKALHPRQRIAVQQ